ncbi:MAG: DNA primase [Candidatus Nealsonbacteria bacterium CG10_big_fil_rev_8_21_14_0_10_36_24]|uniref:DNA primase n=2 Tax=Candidatus Nealsoniibacteriota TaxID=1817911 RepID=A0A2H0YP07_9BACT|nr:MAG: DNA primase [Candidatus Nealsonbacteria bacterium CG10_big_fil_rev_8_21_14_0_10_36_24]PIS40225.1 MAG: DNA primase [Candidatus Nealsonbacteria bacterium CG08_land_8_20_14_0_20_36_22]
MLNSPVDEIKSRLDIVEVIRNYIKLQKAGANYRAICPFHSENKPSFFVSPARQIWHCFGCQKGGDIFGFVKEIEGVEFGDALRILAQKAGVELKKQDPKIISQRQRLYEISDLACRFFEKQLKESSTGREAKKYLLSRGVKEETIKEWRLGYAPDTWEGLSDFLVGRGCEREEIAQAGLILKSEKTNNFYDRFRGRIIFPIFDLASQVIGFGARVFQDQKSKIKNQKYDDVAKYVNTPNTLLYDKSRVLYGLNKAGKEIRKKDSCILVEGYMDVITAHQAGFENVVATSGTALTPWQLNILKRHSDNLLTAFDMDIAGDNATKRGIDLAQSQDFNIKIITMPKDKDPADVISENPQEWQNLIEKAKSIHDFYFENTLARFDKNTLDGKIGISKILLPVIKRISNKIEQNFWIQSLTRVLGTKEEDILEELSKINFSQDEFGDKEVVSSPQKTRRELLEEYLLTLAFKRSENFSLVKEDDFVLLSLPTIKLINYFWGKEKQDELSQELRDKMNYLSFKTEFLEIDNDKIKTEFKNCLQEIRTLALKNKLDDISKEIKNAEEEKNFEKVQELVHKFYNLCQERKL